jgi:hypothetical protein
MRDSQVRLAFRRAGALVSALTVMFVLWSLALAPPGFAQERPLEGAETMTPAEDAKIAEAPAQCEGELGVVLATLKVCSYCTQDNCGCIPREECVLEYSCSCSPIQCTRSCQYRFCRV